MAKQTVNLGTAANDGTGDPLRTAFDKLNDNFDEVYGDNFVTNAMLNDNVVGNAEMKDNAIDNAELATRYKGKATSSSTGSQNLDCSSASFFLLTGNITTATLTLQGLKAGQSIDILLTGTLTSAAITLDTDFTTDTIYRVGDNELDTSTNNIIQVTCLEDNDSSAKIAYSVATFQVDATP